MFNKVIACGMAVFFFTSALNAQTISGVVKDALLDQPIEGATISIVELKQSFQTNAEGAFSTGTLKPGTYTIQTEAKGYLKHSKGIILKSQNEVGVSEMKLDLKIYNISSNADKSKGTMAVNYFFPGHGNVLIVIYDSKGNKVRNAIDRSRQGGMRIYSWDGRDNQGRTVPPGQYTCRISCGTMVMNRELNWKGSGGKNK